MKLTVKTLRGTHFQIQVNPNDSIMAVKKNIEEVQGKDNYPWGQQLLIHNGKVLKDESSLEENKVSEDGFLVVMLSKSKSGTTGGSSVTQSSTTAPPPQQPKVSVPTAQQPLTDPPVLMPAPLEHTSVTMPTTDTYDQAASNLVAVSNFDAIVQHLLEMGSGSWDRDTVLRALRAAYNNPERAVDYLYSGIPPSAEVAVPATHFPLSQTSGHGINPGDGSATRAAMPSGLPNSAPLDMFPQGSSSGLDANAGSLDFLRDNQQFQALRAMVQENPHILQPTLQAFNKENPQHFNLIQDHYAEFLHLINEPVDLEGYAFGQEEEMPHTIAVTIEEQEAVARLEAMGFERARVIEAFLACDRNEALAANYLLEHAADED